ncbi:TPA: hypothetical protein ENS27_16060 [bacterium]|nr:hypothetical protein [bacterium]
MKKAIEIVAMLLMASLTLPLIQTCSSQSGPLDFPQMYIDTPKPYEETIYQNSPSVIKVYAYTNVSSPVQCVDIFYSIDDSPNRTLSLSKMPSLQEITVVNFAYGSLNNLTFGYHTIDAYSTYTDGEVLSRSVRFFVNATSNNPLVLLSPLNTTYNNNEVPLTCIIDNQLTIEYSLDNAGYIPSDSNLTLTGLSNGQHNLTVKAVSQYGTYSEQSVNFTISLQRFVTIGQLAILVMIAVVVSITLVFAWYYRRHRRNQ